MTNEQMDKNFFKKNVPKSRQNFQKNPKKFYMPKIVSEEKLWTTDSTSRKLDQFFVKLPFDR